MQQLTTQVSKLEWMLKIRDEAGFAFAHDESMYLVAEAEWVNKQDNPNGFLFVTNQRIVFEQKEKTGKKFGLFGGKQTQDVKLDFPLSSVTHVEPENKGFLGGKDLLHLKLGAPATFADVTIEVKGGVSAKDWAEHIQRAVRGDIESEVVQ